MKQKLDINSDSQEEEEEPKNQPEIVWCKNQEEEVAVDDSNEEIPDGIKLHRQLSLHFAHISIFLENEIQPDDVNSRVGIITHIDDGLFTVDVDGEDHAVRSVADSTCDFIKGDKVKTKSLKYFFI